jgi:hypothetical protein
MAMARQAGAGPIAQQRRRRSTVRIAMQPDRIDALAERLEGERRRVAQQISDNQNSVSRIAAAVAVQPTMPPCAATL